MAAGARLKGRNRIMCPTQDCKTCGPRTAVTGQQGGCWATLTFIQTPDGLRCQARHAQQNSPQHAAVAAAGLRPLKPLPGREHDRSRCGAAACTAARAARPATGAPAAATASTAAAVGHQALLCVPALQAELERGAGAPAAGVWRHGQAVEAEGGDGLARRGGPLGSGVGQRKHHILRDGDHSK